MNTKRHATSLYHLGNLGVSGAKVAKTKYNRLGHQEVHELSYSLEYCNSISTSANMKQPNFLLEKLLLHKS